MILVIYASYHFELHFVKTGDIILRNGVPVRYERNCMNEKLSKKQDWFRHMDIVAVRISNANDAVIQLLIILSLWKTISTTSQNKRRFGKQLYWMNAIALNSNNHDFIRW